jgi:hypothetical protein
LGGLGTGIGEGDRGVVCGRGSGCCAAREKEQEMDGDAEDAREAELHYQQSIAMTPSGASSSASSVAGTFWTPASSVAATTTSLSVPGSAATSTLSLNNTTAGLAASLDFPYQQQQRRTPSPALKPGYDRHEVEGIGGVVKKMRVRMVRVGACVPEWEDERVRGDVLARELQGRRRSWCGWCQRVIPSKKDYELDRQRAAEAAGNGAVDDKKVGK